MASLIVLFALIAAAAAAPLIESWLGVDAFTADLHQRLLDPSLEHLLGTDEIGRDHLVRLLYGGRVSLTVGLIAALFSAVIGTIIGICAAITAVASIASLCALRIALSLYRYSPS